MDEEGWKMGGHDVAVHRLAPPNITLLRLRGFDDHVIAKVEACLSTMIPRVPNQVLGTRPRVAWLAPGEWMVFDSGVAADALLDAAKDAAIAHAAEVGDGWVAYAVAGSKARDLLAKGCTLDLHPRVFGGGRCAQTALAQVFVLIDRQSSLAPLFHIYADASYAHHLELWFEDALLEFQFEEVI